MAKRIAIINDLKDKISVITSKDTEQSARNLNTVSNAVNKFCVEIQWVFDYLASEENHGTGALQLIEDLVWLNDRIRKLDGSDRDKSAMQISQLAGALADPLRRLNRRAARYHACHDAITELLCSLFDFEDGSKRDAKIVRSAVRTWKKLERSTGTAAP